MHTIRQWDWIWNAYSIWIKKTIPGALLLTISTLHTSNIMSMSTYKQFRSRRAGWNRAVSSGPPLFSSICNVKEIPILNNRLVWTFDWINDIPTIHTLAWNIPLSYSVLKGLKWKKNTFPDFSKSLRITQSKDYSSDFGRPVSDMWMYHFPTNIDYHPAIHTA